MIVVCYNSHFVSQSVRPELVFSILQYLKNVNHLYEHINVKDIISTPEEDDEDIDFSVNENPYEIF